MFLNFIVIDKDEEEQDSDDTDDDEPELSMSENEEDEESVSFWKQCCSFFQCFLLYDFSDQQNKNFA